MEPCSQREAQVRAMGRPRKGLNKPRKRKNDRIGGLLQLLGGTARGRKNSRGTYRGLKHFWEG